MTLKALAPLLDPVLGQDMELRLCVERMELILLGPFTFFAHASLVLSYLFTLQGGSLL